MSSRTPREAEPREHKRSPRQIQLSEEEKAVLVECRRNSLARGIPLGVGALLTLRWFVHQGRVPSHVTRWTGLYYTGAFLGAFYFGVASYEQTCRDKIMALDNSFLKEQLQKKDSAKLRGVGSYDSHEAQSSTPKQQRDYPPVKRPPPPPTSSTPHIRPPDVRLKEGPSINTGYEKDRAMLETKEEMAEQPDAFGGGGYEVRQPVETPQDPPPPKSRGKSYDEIRESARRRYPEERDSRGRGQEEGDWRQQQHKRVVRKNKYGDDIEE